MIAKDMENHPGKLPTIQDFLFKMRKQLLICIEFINDLNEQSHAERIIIYTNVNLRGINAMKIYDSIATVGEIRVYWRADFQSGSRVLKKVF